MIGNVRNGSQEVMRFENWLLRGPQMDPSKLLRASNDGKVGWNTAEYATVILASDWLYFLGYGIKCNTESHRLSFYPRAIEQ